MKIKQILLFAILLIFVSGCVAKKRVLNIQNENLCSTAVATLYLNKLEIKNSADSFNIPEDKIKAALADSLKETNCFRVSIQERDEESLNVEDEYLLDIKATLFQEKETSKKNIFKKEQKEFLSLTLALYAYNKSKNVSAKTTSELLANKSKILGLTIQDEQERDRKTVLTNATKQVSILLKDGFDKLQDSRH
ncbi:hypothetical protein [Sulfurimonas sp.]|jgi:hypothetical protein|uniref:hypothetical protein n=1 Tax=Sulfurimonas sp. TaxID=2022749 RepID=UPI0025CDCBB5|nr:hypothetical protein [Sulfurimonas sp.]MCK9474126.1 hypothetical protein [Sulfurimonas sp.]MDD3505498.1 hypothetical protein [Sulfurimonas sp.]